MRISDLSSDVCSSDLLDAALARKPKVFLFNNPSNPTGMVYTGDEISAQADVLVRHPDTWIITDDIYNKMLFEERKSVGSGKRELVRVDLGCRRIIKKKTAG